MRFAVLCLVLAACGGPITPPYIVHNRPPDEADPKVMRPPANAPADPIGTTRPGTRSCTENRDCKVGEVCLSPDYVAPAAPLAASSGPGASSIGGPGAGSAGAGSTSAGSSRAGGTSAGGTGAGGTSAGGTGPGSPGARSISAGGSGAVAQCQGDGQCTQGFVCAAGACVAPCSEGSCPVGLECRAGGRCLPIACSAPGAPVCAQNFRCNSSAGTCERQACTSRAQCDSGVCFQGRCFAHDAYCSPQNSSPPR